MVKNAKIEEFRLSLWDTIIFISLTAHRYITHQYAPSTILQKLV